MKSEYIVLGVIALVVIAGGGWYLYQRNQVMPTNVPAVVIEESITEELSSPSAKAGEVKEFTITNSGFKFTPSEIKVEKGDVVRVTFKSKAGVHNFVIDEFNVKTEELGNGKSETVEFVADKVGTFEFYCSIANHRLQGMKGNLVVE